MEDFRLGTVDAQRLIALLRVVDPALLSEFTTGGRPPGATPFHMVCSGQDKQAERVEIIKEMLRLSASPSLKMRSNGATPLHRAAGSGARDVVEELLRSRAHVNLQNEAGATPLDACYRSSGKAAIFMKMILIISFLTRPPADGPPAVLISCSMSSCQCADLIRAAGGRHGSKVAGGSQRGPVPPSHARQQRVERWRERPQPAPTPHWEDWSAWQWSPWGWWLTANHW